MKRMIGIILSLLFLLSAAGCGKQANRGFQPAAAENTPSLSQAMEQTGNLMRELGQEETESFVSAAEEEILSSEEPEEEPPVPAEAEETEPEVKQGTVSNGVYTNETLGITCTLDDSWTFMSEEELESESSGENEGLPDGMRSMDMLAISRSGGMSINIFYKYLGEDFSYLSMGTILRLTEDRIVQGFEDMGYEDATYEVDAFDFAGQKRDGIDISGNLYGTKVYQRQIPIMIGPYCCYVTLSSFGEDKTDQMLDYFQAL